MSSLVQFSSRDTADMEYLAAINSSDLGGLESNNRKRRSTSGDEFHLECDASLVDMNDRAYVTGIIDRSMKRLKVDRLDLVQFHWWNYAVPGAVEDYHPHCVRLAETAIDPAKNPAIKTVVLAADWYGYFNNSSYRVEGENSGPMNIGTPAWNEAFSRLSNMMGEFKAQGKAVWLVLNMPTGAELEPRLSLRRSISSGTESVPLYFDRAKFETGWAPIRSKLMDIAVSSGAKIIDPIASLCDETACQVKTAEGMLMYKDRGHLRSSYVRDHASFLDVTLEPAGMSRR